MNIDSKFKGKRIDTGEWVYGDLCTQHHYYESLIGVWNRDTHECDWVPVDPVTVGQFTGLYDKYGKEIYDGDIVRGNTHRDDGEKLTSIIEWRFNGFSVEAEDFGWEELEVIGNLHDNPELIENQIK